MQCIQGAKSWQQMWRVAFCPFSYLHDGLIDSLESGVYFDFCTLNQRGECFTPKRVGCWTGGLRLSQSGCPLCACTVILLFIVPQVVRPPPLTPTSPGASVGQQDVFPGPEGQVSDRTQALFKAVSDAALKCCSDRLSAQDTHSAVGSRGSHFLSSSLQSHRVWICSPALGERGLIYSYGRSVSWKGREVLICEADS